MESLVRVTRFGGGGKKLSLARLPGASTTTNRAVKEPARPAMINGRAARLNESEDMTHTITASNNPAVCRNTKASVNPPAKKVTNALKMISDQATRLCAVL